MACNKFEDWLNHRSSCNWLQLSEEMSCHVRDCPDCAKTLQTAKDVRQEFLKVSISPAKLESSWQHIAAKMGPQTAPPSQSRPFSSETFSWKWFFGFSLAFSFALAFGLFLSMRPEGAPPSTIVDRESATISAVGTIQGSGGKHLRQNRDTLLGATDLGLLPEDEVALLFPHSKGHMRFQDNSRVDIAGSCKMRFSPKEFQIVSGECRVSLTKGKDPLKIRIPGAVLAIRGTVLQMNLQATGGTIDLLEGLIDVEPSAGSLASFSWKAGTRLCIRGNSLVSGPVTIPDPQGTPFSPPSMQEPLGVDTNPGFPVSTGSDSGQGKATTSSDLKSVLSTK